MTTLSIGGAPLVKTDDQRRAERRARRARTWWPSTAAARGVLYLLLMLALVGADRVVTGARMVLAALG